MLTKENRKDLRNSAYSLREDYGLTWTAIGDNIGVSRKVAKRLYDEYTKVEGLLEKIESSGIPEANPVDLDIERFKPLHVYGDAAIACDWHIPLHDPRMVNKLFEKIYEFEIKKLVVPGDLFNMDEFSHYKPHQPEAAFELEREAATDIVSKALDLVDEVVLSWGNHDFRMTRFLDYKYSFEACIRYVLQELGEEKLSRVTITDLDHIIYHPGNYDIRLCHQENFSKVPLTVPRQLVPKYGMSVYSAHSHHFAQGVALDGKHLIFEGGGLFSPERTQYIKRTNAHHNWVQGFYIWKDGLCHPFSPIYHNL